MAGFLSLTMGGATVLKVGGQFCERSEQKNVFVYFDPHFLASGGQNIG